MKILITGGHLSPALSVIDEIEKKAGIVFVGRKYVNDREKSHSLEYQEISKKNINFYHLDVPRLTRLLNVKLFMNLLKIPTGFFRAFRLNKKLKPDTILSFGGYIGFPICLTGYLLGIPVYIHEQTITPGLANRLAGFIAKKIFVSFEETKKFFNQAKVILTGNPVRKKVLKTIKKPFRLIKNRPVIFFSGGSLGSHSLNLHLEKILVGLLKKYTVIHSTGNVSEFSDYSRLIKLRDQLLPGLKNNYFVKEFFYEEEMGFIYSLADLAVCRSGANTFFELLARKIPALFIPLPWSGADEQKKHALIFKKAGAGEIFDQYQDSQSLLKLIDHMISRLDDYKKNFKNVELLYKDNAEKTIAAEILPGYSV